MKLIGEQKTSLGYGAVYLTASKVINLLISTITLLFLSRLLSLEEYGTYSEILLVVNLTSTLFMMGLPNSINYFLPRAENQEERSDFLSVYYTLSSILSVSVGIALACAVPLIVLYFGDASIQDFKYFLAVYPWAYVISSNIDNILVVYNKTNILAIYRFINSLLLLLSVLVTKWLELGFDEYMLVFLIVNAISAVAVYVISYRLCAGIKILFRIDLIKKILVFSIPLGIASVVGTLDIEIDKLLIGYLMPADQMAIYTNASKELPVTIISASITAVLLPKMAKLIKHGEDEKAVGLWSNATELSMIFMAFFVAGIFTYAKDVMSILYSDKYLSGIGVFRVYVIVLLLRCTYFGIVLSAKGFSKKILICSVFALITNILLNPIFYAVLGMIGPAIATLLSIALTNFLQIVMSAKSTDIKIGKMLPWKKFISILIINMLLALCFGVLKEVLPLERYISSVLESIILGIVWCGMYYEIMKGRIKHLWNKINKV